MMAPMNQSEFTTLKGNKRKALNITIYHVGSNESLHERNSIKEQ